MRTFVLLLFVVSPLLCFAQKVVPYSIVNSGDDDYAIAFRTAGHTTEAWYTSSSGMADKRARRLLYISNGNTTSTNVQPLPASLNDESGVKIPLNGCVTFSSCNPDYAVMVSNRYVDGKSHGNDLYEIRYAANAWTVSRIDVLNSEAWDDTPSLSPDGSLLYFSSDRNSPYSRSTDIFVSKRKDKGWSAPEIVRQISTNAYSEQTPFASQDGYLYYATNQTKLGDYDIWRAQYDLASGQIIGSPEPLLIDGVNTESSDEGHPSFSPGGSWFFFSSNRSAKRDYDIYMVNNGGGADTLDVHVVVRTRKIDKLTNMPEDSVGAYQNKVLHDYDMNTRKASTFTTSSSGQVLIISNKDRTDPLFDISKHTLALEAEVKDPRFVSSKDTVIYDGFCAGKKEHTLIVWDTAAYYIPECVQDFPVKNVRFFVTGYWCPTTEKYVNVLNCSCIITCDTCTSINESAQPHLNCGDDDEFYNYSLVKARVDLSRKQGSACINMHEAKTKGHEYAMEVDSAVVRIVASMRSALQVACVQREIAKGKKITVQVTGWTDPRPLDNACAYTGKTIDFSKSFVKLNMTDSPYIINDTLQGNSRVKFSRSSAGGNYLLSQLRAYYTAVMFDKIWEEQVSDYKNMKHNGTLELVALGKAVSQENRDYSERRSVEIRVSVPITDREVVRGQIPDPGQTVKLCEQPCK